MESWTEKIVKFYDRDCTVECRRYVMFRLFGTGSGRVEKEGALALALWLGRPRLCGEGTVMSPWVVHHAAN